MKQYFIFQKGKFRRTFTVEDSTGSVLYAGKVYISPVSNKFIVFDRDEAKVAEITQMISLIVPKFRIRIKNEPAFTITRKLGFCVEYLIPKKQQVVRASADCDRYLVCDQNRNTLYEIIKDLHVTSHHYTLLLDDTQDCLEPFCIAIALDSAMRATSK